MVELWHAILAGDGFAILSQGLGFLALIVSFSSFQAKKQSTIMILQTVSTALFTLHMYLIGAFCGMLLNIIACMRSIVFSFRNRSRFAAWIGWIPVFILLSALCATLSLFGARAIGEFLGFADISLPALIPADGEGWIALLPFGGMVVTTFAGHSSRASTVRLLTLFNSPFWFSYNLLVPTPSVAGALTEILISSSIVIGMLRLDRKRPQKTQEG